MPSKYLIYALTDPRTKGWEYIGKSCSGLKRPRVGHKAPCNLVASTLKNNWIKSLLKQGLMYGVDILEEFDSPEALIEAEIEWIAAARAAGIHLRNGTDGGEGVSGRVHSEETRKRISISHTGKVLSPETKAKLSEIGKTQDHSLLQEGREKYWTPERRAEFSLIKQEQAKDPEIYKHLVEGGYRAQEVAGDRCIAALRTDTAKKNHAIAQRKRFADPAARRAASRCKGGRSITDGTTVFDSVNEAARSTGVPRANIQAVLRGARRVAGGRVFSYAEEGAKL